MRCSITWFCCLVLTGSTLWAQGPGPSRYFPLNTPLPPPGRAGEWSGALGKATPPRFQPVQIQLPSGGQVTWYGSRGFESALMGTAPSMAGLLVGPVYRLKLSDIPEFPGVELYPTVEMVDRLHPPAGRENDFPVIIGFTEEELDSAARGRLVTKVIYLEQPNRASLQYPGRGRAVGPILIPPRDNPLEVADLHGRPLAIIRLGGRVPDVSRPEPGFFGSGAPVQPILPAPDEATETVIVPPGPQAARDAAPLVDLPPEDIVPDEPTEPQPAEPAFESEFE